MEFLFVVGCAMISMNCTYPVSAWCLQVFNSAVYGCVWSQIQPGINPDGNQPNQHELWRLWDEGHKDSLPKWIH